MPYFNDRLDEGLLHREMRLNGRVLARDFFQPSVADALARALQGIDWSLTFRQDGGDQVVSGPELRGFAPPQRAALSQRIHLAAEQDFQFSFFTHAMVHSAQQGDAGLLSRFVRWMADEPFLSMMRNISGLEDVNRVYAQATMYARGNFLLAHDDHVEAENRRLAYVINLTRQWRPDWGGLLHFTDADGNVIDTYFPHFNSISLFKVPQTHFVSYVPPFAGAARYAITGWLIAA